LTAARTGTVKTANASVIKRAKRKMFKFGGARPGSRLPSLAPRGLKDLQIVPI
jgi:hypothetical protein